MTALSGSDRSPEQVFVMVPAQRAKAAVARQRVVSVCKLLGAAEYGGPLSAAEAGLLSEAAEGQADDPEAVRDAIRRGKDPLGEAISASRTALERRRIGAIYTPPAAVRAMVDWLVAHEPVRVVDAGCGSGRFVAEVARRAPGLPLVAVDTDPLATLACRATLACLDAPSATVINADYLEVQLPRSAGPTGFLSNPPYVRHHELTQRQKQWAKHRAAEIGLGFSGLAGLHAYFFLATLGHAARDDLGCFITSAEWLDVSYGAAVRQLLHDGLGLESLHLLDAEAAPFDDAMSTAVIVCFRVGRRASQVRVRGLSSLDALGTLSDSGVPRPRETLAPDRKWSPQVRHVGRRRSEALVRLGELVRVSRGVVTGHNAFFVLRPSSAAALGLEPWTTPVLSDAHEVLKASGVVRRTDSTRLLLAPPRTIDLDAPSCEPLRRYLAQGLRLGVPERYICSHRRPWWYVGAKHPAVVATYMARQPPAFALNPCRMAILNVLHGFYPRVDMDDEQLAGLVGYLNAHRAMLRGHGRTYQGGLEKFEPREMEALLVPPLDRLASYAEDLADAP